MPHLSFRWRSLCVAALALCSFRLHAETVKDMPAPTGYVTDLAGVLSQQGIAQMEQLCTEVDQQAHAQIAVVTIQSLPEDSDIDEFANQLFAKWKIGAKGTDKGVLLLFAIKDHKRRIEVGYGLEGALNDAKAGDIGRAMVPQLREGDYDGAVMLGVTQIAQIAAQDANVTITDLPAMQMAPHQQPVTRAQRIGSIVVGLLILLVVIYVLSHAGPSGLLWFLIGNALGGGGRGRGGYGGGEGGGGGGFGGFGGGGSGGGGASGGW